MKYIFDLVDGNIKTKDSQGKDQVEISTLRVDETGKLIGVGIAEILIQDDSSYQGNPLNKFPFIQGSEGAISKHELKEGKDKRNLGEIDLLYEILMNPDGELSPEAEKLKKIIKKNLEPKKK